MRLCFCLVGRAVDIQMKSIKKKGTYNYLTDSIRKIREVQLPLQTLSNQTFH
ncbi:hypothetical protein Syun_007236 [Stephania yunnanensis]|uniref:Uncharacterized protein n=1 Tax=Stephania yunnanensis TaxID=152371 RepID=A0AAP0KZ61_9MAGN